jgi:hypothetical protein
MIRKIMQQDELLLKPPVLIDVGASGEIHSSWKSIAPYSICIGFDGDVRETDFYESDNSGYKKLYIFNKIVSENSQDTDFFLTSSPFCSSRLEPNKEELQNWAFGELFEIDKKISMKSTTIDEILNVLDLNYIDWFKTDSQGTDLRIYDSIDLAISNNIIIAEFEPGIINAYKKEDKLYKIIEYMDTKEYWMSEMVVKGSQRISQINFKKYFSNYIGKLHNFRFLQKEAASWAEVTYINTFQSDTLLTKRNLLLGCAISIANEQYGFSIDLATKAKEYYHDSIFDEILEYSLGMINGKKYFMLYKRIVNKIKSFR